MFLVQNRKTNTEFLFFKKVPDVLKHVLEHFNVFFKNPNLVYEIGIYVY